ncbi:MAG: DUF4249 domain-containing protein, partial [Bacteroidota bacterium]
VIEGKITDEEGYQSIFVSRSSMVSDPQKLPVSDCKVRIYNGEGNVFHANEYEQGTYNAYIEEQYLETGSVYWIEITTPEGELLRSDKDTLRHCSEIDSIYYQVDEFVGDNPDAYIPGIQFYVNYDGKQTNSRRIKYEIEETWEYESLYPIQWIWDGFRLTTYETPDYSKYVCWQTQISSDIYMLSTGNLNSNQYNQYPLHHILNYSSKIQIGYSLLVKQLSISESAYLYFEKIRDNVIESGGLYEAQPQQVEGNIINVTDPGKRVLGYFYTAGKHEKRIFISKVEGLELAPIIPCSPVALDLGYGILRNLDKPVYLWLEEGTYLLPDLCVDCTVRGGSTQKPDFWPN